MMEEDRYILGERIKCYEERNGRSNIATIGYRQNLPKDNNDRCNIGVWSLDTIEKCNELANNLNFWSREGWYLEIVVHAVGEEKRKFTESFMNFLMANFMFTEIYVADNSFDASTNQQIKELLARNRRFQSQSYRHKLNIAGSSSVAAILIGSLFTLSFPIMLSSLAVSSAYIWHRWHSRWNNMNEQFDRHNSQEYFYDDLIFSIAIPLLMAPVVGYAAAACALTATMTGLSIEAFRKIFIKNSIIKYLRENRPLTKTEKQSIDQGLKDQEPEAQKSYLPTFALSTMQCPGAYYIGNYCPPGSQDELRKRFKI